MCELLCIVRVHYSSVKKSLSQCSTGGRGVPWSSWEERLPCPWDAAAGAAQWPTEGLLARWALRRARVLTSSSSLGWINSTSLWMILSSLSHWKGKEAVMALLTSSHTETPFRAQSTTHQVPGHRLFAQHVAPGPERKGSDLTFIG